VRGLVLVLGLALAGCVSAGGGPRGPTAGGCITFVVENRSWERATLYLLGPRSRIGEIEGQKTQAFQECGRHEAPARVEISYLAGTRYVLRRESNVWQRGDVIGIVIGHRPEHGDIVRLGPGEVGHGAGALVLGPEYDVPSERHWRLRPVPEIYRTWHAEFNECAGTTAVFDDIDWWAVHAPDGFYLYGAGPFVGYYDDRGDERDRIYLVSHDLEDEGLVKHEIGHQESAPDSHPVPVPYGDCAPRWYNNQVWKR